MSLINNKKWVTKQLSAWKYNILILAQSLRKVKYKHLRDECLNIAIRTILKLIDQDAYWLMRKYAIIISIQPKKYVIFIK